MNTFQKTCMFGAFIMTLAGTASADIIKIDTGGTIKVGDYETVCDKKPKACGDHVKLPPRPKPKPQPKPRQANSFGATLAPVFGLAFR
ncbi:MAG: hypothetical protein ACRBB0_22180 [Pelagimonas sp.]|uniref:hypothetical protein n=1 Tax=Pelagimonas sp. TaxID=2073170 RepID=UPI003D6A617B